MRLLGGLIVAVLRWRNVRRHRRCLASIARLERLVFPEYFGGSDEFVLTPGAVWEVDDPMAVAIMYKHALFGSGHYARIVYGSNLLSDHARALA